MKIRNEKYEAVKIKWDGIDLPLRAGTPIDIGGNIANNANAIGIVMQTVTVRPVVDTLYIMMSGDVDLKELEKEAGITLSDEAKTAMSGINFWMDNARIYQPAPSEGGGGGGTDRFFEVQFNEDTLTLDKTWQEIFDLIEDGKIPFFIVSSDTPDYNFAARYQCDVANQQENVFSVYFYNGIFSNGGGVVHAMPFLTDSANGYPVLDD